MAMENQIKIQYFENLFTYSNVPIIIWDKEFKITHFNTASEKLTGRNAESVIGESVEILFPESLVNTTMSLIRKTEMGYRMEDNEIEVIHENGFVNSVIWNSAPIFDTDGKTVIATIAQGHDITSRKRSERSLQESQEKYYYLYENAPIGMYHTKIDGSGILAINNTFCKMLDFSKEELLGSSSAIRWADPDRRNEILKIINEHGVAINFDADILKKNGTKIACLLSMKIFKEKGYIEGFIVDNTERKKEQQEIIDSEKKFKSVLQSAKDSIVLINQNGVIVFWNHFSEKVFGYNENEVVGKPFTSIIPERFKVDILQKFDQHISTSKEFLMDNTVELYGLRKNGKEFPVELSLSHWTNENEKFYCGIIRDISDRKNAEEEQKNNFNKLSEIAFLQTHQVRAPIASILGLIDLINFAKPEDPQNFEIFYHLKKATLFCDNVIKEIVEKTTEIEELFKKI